MSAAMAVFRTIGTSALESIERLQMVEVLVVQHECLGHRTD